MQNLLIKRIISQLSSTNNDGQTIIELLIATFVVGAVVTGVAVALTYNINRNAEIRYRETGATLAQQGLEAIRRERERNNWGEFYDTLNNSTYCINDLNFTVGSMSSGDCAGTFEAANTDYQREVVVSKSTDGNGTETVNLAVTVSWHVGTEDEASVSVSHTMKERLN